MTEGVACPTVRLLHLISPRRFQLFMAVLIVPQKFLLFVQHNTMGLRSEYKGPISRPVLRFHLLSVALCYT